MNTIVSLIFSSEQTAPDFMGSEFEFITAEFLRACCVQKTSVVFGQNYVYIIYNSHVEL